MENKGPRKYTHSGMTCTSCDYHKSQMIHSGRNPKYSHRCTHPEIKQEHGIYAALHGNLPEDAETPDWCPFLKKK